MSGTHIEASFTTTPQTVIQSYRACHRGAYLFRWLLVAIGVIVSVLLRDPVFAIGGVALFGYGWWSVRKQLRPYLAGPREVTVTMTDDEYLTHGPDRATSRTWSTFQTVHRVGDFWVLRISNMAALALPVSALDQLQTEAFIGLMTSKGLLREQ
jgi:hypothetical protein